MNIFEKYIKFLKDDIRSGAREINSVDLSQFNFGAEYEFLVPYDKFNEAPNKAIARAKKSLENQLSISISDDMSKYITKQQAASEYRLITDESVKSDIDEDTYSLEFVTPIITHDKFFNTTKTVFDIILNNGYETSGTAGMHVGISFKDTDKNKKIDPLKLVLFSSDQFFRDTWPRVRKKLDSGEISSDYVKSNLAMIRKIIKRVVFYRSDELRTIDSENIAELITDWLDEHKRNWLATDPEWRGKHFAVNVGRLSDGYVEFRVIGGKDYHKRFNEVEYSVKRFCLSLIQSTSEDTKRDYLKKLYKILNSVLDDLEDFDKMHSGIEGENTAINIKNPNAQKLLANSQPIFLNNPKLKENIYNIAQAFEKNKKDGVASILYILTQDFGKVKFKAGLRKVLALLARIYGVNKVDLQKVYSDTYFEPGKVPEKPKDENEDSEYWDYAEGIKDEHKISSDNIIKILGL